ncbi:efflux RND transporter permease subunit [Roseimaritima sediminicola]|uniref:efflux RND transporter permease subunit n=1 Tax=Roseimaritima sediminicola TaxID=2662066 RepID=UPI001298310A|nr:efflux RND transporter permease subunit [Roseimaritima sediminicola]
MPRSPGPNGWFARCLQAIVDYPWLSGFALVLLSAVAAIGHYDPYLLLPDPAPNPPPRQVDTAQAPPAEESARQRAAASVQPVRLGRADSIVVCEADNFFTPANAQALREAVQRLEALPFVRGVMWMDRAPLLNVFGLPEPILPRSPNASATRFEQARRRALKHPLVVGQMLSADGQTTLLMVRIDWLYITADDDCTDTLRETAASAVQDTPGAEIRFRVTGDAPIHLLTVNAHERDTLKYQIIAYSITLAMAVILFRGIAAVLIVALAPTLGVLWTMGVLHYFDLQDSPFNAVILPVLLCMVGFTDGVHMMVQIRRQRASGLTPREASRAAIGEVGLACALTSLTTGIGFASLSFAHHELVREFGYCCVIGVTLTFLSVITVIPLACCTPLGRNVARSYGDNLVDRNLERIGGIVDFVLRHRRKFTVGGIVGTAVLMAITLSLRPDERITSALSETAEPVAALRHIDEALGGMEQARVYVHWDRPREEYDPELATILGRVDALIRRDPLLGRPLSLHSLLSALPGQGPPEQRMSLMELLPPPLKRAFYRPDERTAEVVFRVQDLGIAKYDASFTAIEAELKKLEQQHPQYSLTLAGAGPSRWRNLYRIVLDLAASLGTASVVIFLVIAAVYRSLLLGLISVVPNLFPLAITGTALVFTGQSLELVSVCAFTVCLGIAVDDTIHFLTRFQEERRRSGDTDVAIRRVFVGVGTALIMTTAVLIVGFSSALLSDARDTQIFVTMGILTIAAALVADLTILPAMLATFTKPRQSSVGSRS